MTRGSLSARKKSGNIWQVFCVLVVFVLLVLFSASSGLKLVALSVDEWGDHHSQATFAGTLLNLVQAEKPVLLHIEQLHARTQAPALADFMRSCMAKVPVGPTILAIVTDHAANMLAAVDLMLLMITTRS